MHQGSKAGAGTRIAFIMMPSGNHEEYKGGRVESDFIYQDIICPALRRVLGDDVEIIREIDNRSPGAITRELIRHLAEADICVVDVTGLNPNVFLELGIRYALRRSTTILLRQSGTELPFDIKEYRCVDYSPLYTGPRKAIDDIAAMVAKALGGPRSDSLVFTVLPNLRVELPGVIGGEDGEDEERSPGVMPWAEYWRRLEVVVQRLRDVVNDGRFVPQAVLGISNGGLVYADLLGRHLFTSTPVLSLWADRHNKDGNFFDNSVNAGVVAGIESRVVATKPMKRARQANGQPVMKEPSEAPSSKLILLVDDIIASGTTLRQAIKYLEKRLPHWKVYFLPLFSRNEKYLDLIRDHIVWSAPVFRPALPDAEIAGLHAAERMALPYKKEIRSA